MTVTPQQLKEFAGRFSALFAGCDLDNSSETEALAKFRAMRRMAGDVGTRIIDLLQLEEIRSALHAQMQPVKMENRELDDALEQAEALRQELTDRMRNVRELAEQLKREKEVSEGLRQQLAGSRPATWQSPPQQQQPHHPYAQPPQWPQQHTQAQVWQPSQRGFVGSFIDEFLASSGLSPTALKAFLVGVLLLAGLCILF